MSLASRCLSKSLRSAHRIPIKPLKNLTRPSVNFSPSSSLFATRAFTSFSPSLAKKASTRGSSNNEHSALEVQEKFDASRVEKEMNSGVSKLRVEIKNIVNRVGRLTPAYLDGVKVEVEGGVRSPIEGLAQVIVLDPTKLSVVAYDASHTKMIEQALYDSSLNLTPNLQPDGSIHLAIPKLTTESRQLLSKKAGQVCEQARSVIRNSRQLAQKASRKDLDGNLITKDDFKSNNKVLDEITKAHTKLVDEIENKSKRVLLDQ